MTTTAQVVAVTPTHKYGPDRTPLDVVRLHWEGKAYYWSTEPGRYTEGQQVPVNPPTDQGGNITPVDGGIGYAGHVTGQQP